MASIDLGDISLASTSITANYPETAPPPELRSEANSGLFVSESANASQALGRPQRTACRSRSVIHLQPRLDTAHLSFRTSHQASPVELQQHLFRASHQASPAKLQQHDCCSSGLLLQPACRPIPQEQLTTEVKSIYSGLLMVEKKCALVDQQQAKLLTTELKQMSSDYWQALIALHRTLLHEHHNFFLASQRPSASLALRVLAGKYTMPARMRKHGTHDFLEKVRRALPATHDDMHVIIYLAYQMMALLNKTVPTFEDIRIGCPRLGSYRMADGDDEAENRNAWAVIAQSWYPRGIANRQQLPLPRIYKREALSSSRKSKSIPGRLAGHIFVDAIGDTGAKYNFMDDGYARSQVDLTIDRTQIKRIKLANGKTVLTTGVTKTTFQFRDESEQHAQIFHLLPKCHHKVILGYPFLKVTETFTDNLKRLRRVVIHTVSRVDAHDFFYIGGSGPSFKGLINGNLQYALADTGAKLLMMDEDYAQELGLTIETGIQHRSRVRFADGTTAMTSGMVHGVSWQYGDDEGEMHMLDFHILKNAPANVILSDDFLLGDDTNAFAEYACYMVDEEVDDDAGCFVIDIDYSYVNPAIDTREYRDQFESVRYGEEEDWIDSLSGEERTAAQATVQLRRRQWDPDLPLTGANAVNVVPTQFRQTSGSRKPITKRFRLRFRIKRRTA